MMGRFLMTSFCLGCLALSAAPSKSKSLPWVLTWSDEFDGPDGSKPDPTKWTFDLGGRGWGNAELETYTQRPQNVVVQQGNLIITALKEDFTGTDGVKRSYTSARLKTQGLFSQTYGRVEARIQIPWGQGIWPAFWMLGENIDSVPWPACGEIDIMENIGREPTIVHGTLHGPGYSADKGPSASYALAQGRLADDYHVYAIEWEPLRICFYVDGNLYSTRIAAQLPQGTRWVFDHPFFLLLNLAVGGTWPGNPDDTTVFPQAMRVDYVRVFRKK